jgi:HrpA-like RNA helicase
MVNTTLPIYASRRKIVEAVRDNPIVIVEAEAGAGKSTQIPQYLLEQGYDVVITQPRRLAARTVAQRVASELGVPLGTSVGYRTAYESQYTKATRCLFVTDGLALKRVLTDSRQSEVLIVDEVHEWNLNIEIVAAWVRQQARLQPEFRVVFMSATLETERLSAFFDNAPVISVPGRTFPVEEQQPVGPKMEDDVVALLRQGKSVLVFQPGKSEIAGTIRYLKKYGLDVEILPLHGDLPYEAQGKCLEIYSRPKCIVSTDIAQTSMTIPGINAVVDSGTRRIHMLVNGVEGLHLVPVARADSEQRKGRAGRTEPGIYINWCPETDRPDYPTAEILRIRLDQAVLRLATAGLAMEEMTFFHQPNVDEIHSAKKTLTTLGCLEADGNVTPAGRRIAMMPTSVRYGRMIVEAENLGVIDDVITVAAIFTHGGIYANPCPTHQTQEKKGCNCWKRLTAYETTSDVMAQLAAYKACAGMSTSQIHENGISPKAYMQVRTERKHLVRELERLGIAIRSSGNPDDILRAVTAGMVDLLHRRDRRKGETVYRRGDGSFSELSHTSVLTADVEWVIGDPFDLDSGTKTVSILRMAMTADLAWLTELAPHLVSRMEGLAPRYDPIHKEVVSVTQTWFNGHIIGEEEVVDPTHPRASSLHQDGHNQEQWERWISNPPQIPLPDFTRPGITIPEIVTQPYKAATNDDPALIAYGYIAPFSLIRKMRDPWFTVAWTQHEQEAIARRQEAVDYLEKNRNAIEAEATRQQEAAQLQNLQEQVAPLQSRLEHLRTTFYYVLPQELRGPLHYQHTLLRDVASNEALEEWAQATEEIISRVEVALTEIETLKANAIELRDEANAVLAESSNLLSDDDYDALDALDVNDAQLPTSMTDLREWVPNAETAITRAKENLARRSRRRSR